jgi:hypothetical protein
LILNGFLCGKSIFSSIILVPLLNVISIDDAMQLVEKQRLIEFAEALRSRLNYFDELENVRFATLIGVLQRFFYSSYEKFLFSCFWNSHPCD